MPAVKKHPFHWPDDKVAAMHAEYLAGALFTDIARKYGCRNSSVRQAFVTRGLKLLKRPNSGCYRKTRHIHTDDEIITIVQGIDRIKVPNELKLDWRQWSIEKRRWFLSLIKAKRPARCRMPDLPCSANVTRFDYCTPEARAIVQAANEGKDSRRAGMKLNLCSEGVIFEGKLWFWNWKLGRFVTGPYHIQTGRREALHWHLYERHHGPIPPGLCVCPADRNPNNLDPANLILKTKNDIARENQATDLNRRSQLHTAALLNRLTPTAP
jgi:hypothetical protein